MTEIAAQLNSEGYRTPKLRKRYTTTSVRKLVSRCGLTSEPIRLGQLEAGEWSLADLTREIQVPADWLHRWALTGRVCCRQIPPRDLWVIWADGRDRRQLRELAASTDIQAFLLPENLSVFYS